MLFFLKLLFFVIIFIWLCINIRNFEIVLLGVGIFFLFFGFCVYIVFVGFFVFLVFVVCFFIFKIEMFFFSCYLDLWVMCLKGL